ncbi:uncharacterized protein LOC105442223 [Strongylocentrotus purpuratus]|uniref:TIR domain-containing protein n=1 Tax=Strongylocentrotus purpuratus TaxID=7668 RepID=A0A7M7HP11_STRPU|nr:uncharacterized protein LOC105442223 [Strongylocentrotus purpuratus]|eukprot:XP_011672445.1 PREDICTED: uncharacterized protein LOC105442223 [Strongylocentrotus purpuratus]
MGSSASSRRISSAKKVGGPLAEGQSKPLTTDGAVVVTDETDGGPSQPKAIASPNSNGKADAQNVAIQQEGTIDDASGTFTNISDILIVDSAAAKAKRCKEFSNGVKTCLTRIKASIKHIQECEGFPCTSCLKMTTDITTVSRNSNIDRNAVGDGIGIDTDYCKMFAYTWKKGDMLKKIEDADQQEELPHETTQMFTFYIALLGSAWNFTDKSDYFCLQMEEDGCLSLIVDWFLHLVESDKAMNKWADDMMFDAMNILENACRRVPSLAPNHHRAVPALQKFGESEETLTQTIAFTTLAKLVKKEEADKLSTNYTCIVSLLSLLKKCLSNPDHKAKTRRQSSKKNMVTVITINAEELVQSVDDLAINDNNKRLIVEKGGIPILAKLLQRDCSVEEKTSAANGLWRLAFLKENKEKLRKEQGIIYNLTENSQSENEKLRNACMGALFEIYESKLPEGLTRRKTDVESPQKATSGSAKSSGHIMLSYKWEHPSKPVMREFKKQLRKRGYNVWMDEDHMMGDKIGAMAEAVEKADMVIACITRGYQDSQDCRTEASYAYECKKKIIPVKVNNDFKASGWLGGITAGKIYYIVQQPELVSEVLSSIIEKEFAVKKETVQNVNAAPGPPSQEEEPKITAVESQVPGWDSKKVQDWLAANNVTTRNKALKTFNGIQLLQLKKQLINVPQAFYQSMKDDLKVPYSDVLSLAGALEKLN